MGIGFAGEVRTSGRFGFQPVGGLIDGTDPTMQWNDVVGLPFSMQYLYGTLRAKDGTYYWPIRGTFRDRLRTMHLSEAAEGQDFAWAPEGEAIGVEDVEHGERDGWMGVWRTDGTPVLATDGPRLRWREGDFLEVEGELVGHGLQFLCPDAQEPMAYTSRVFRASGTVKGTPVTGLVMHDSMHMPLGQNFITSAYITRLQAAWVVFVTEFEDGNVHAGHLIWGTDGFDLMLIERTDGPPLVARDLDVAVRLEDDYPVHVRMTGGGETWVWDAHPSGYRDPIRTDLPEGHRRIQGWVRHADEARQPRCTEALMETYNGRLADVVVGS